MVLQMLSKANLAEISSKVPWTIVLCSFSTIGAWTDDICCLSLVEFLCVRVPFYHIFLTLCQHMYRHSPAWTAWWRCCNDPIILYFVRHHLHCQFPSKSQCQIRFLSPHTCTSLPSIHLCNWHQESKLTIRPPLCFPCGLQPSWIMATIAHIVCCVGWRALHIGTISILRQHTTRLSDLPPHQESCVSTLSLWHSPHPCNNEYKMAPPLNPEQTTWPCLTPFPLCTHWFGHQAPSVASTGISWWETGQILHGHEAPWPPMSHKIRCHLLPPSLCNELAPSYPTGDQPSYCILSARILMEKSTDHLGALVSPCPPPDGSSTL